MQLVCLKMELGCFEFAIFALSSRFLLRVRDFCLEIAIFANIIKVYIYIRPEFGHFKFVGDPGSRVLLIIIHIPSL